jgi:hypothetical protein
MPTTIKKQGKTAPMHPDKSEILKKLDKSTHRVAGSTILPLLKKQGAEEVSLAEVRKRLSALKTPLSSEIISARRKN